MKLQRSTIFALYAVLELARDADTQLATGEIAARYGISAHHLAKVMRQLVRAKLIQSARGAGGGYRLAVNPNRVTLMDVVAVFEDRLTSAFDDEASADDDSSGASGDIGLALQAGRRWPRLRWPPWWTAPAGWPPPPKPRPMPNRTTRRRRPSWRH
jgi:Rrf2 family protein